MQRSVRVVLVKVAVAGAMVAGCADIPRKSATGDEIASRPPALSISKLLRRPSEYYTDDGPDGSAPVDLARVADATPRSEPAHPTANEPYTVFGHDYRPQRVPGNYKRQGTASWYGRKYHGQRTAAGEIYDMYAMSAAHTTLPIPSYARVTNLANRVSVIVRINDRGPFASGRILDVSYAAAHRLGYAASGSAQVEVQSIVPPGSAVAPGERAALDPAIAAAAPVAPPAAPAVPAAATLAPAAPGRAARKTEPSIPVLRARNGIYLQLGVFSVGANAEHFRARAARQFESLGVQVSVEQRGSLHRVQLGPFRDRAAARAASAHVRALLQVKPVMVIR